MLFTARRLDAEGIALIFAAEDSHSFRARGIPELPLSRLDDSAGLELLNDCAGDLAGHVRDHILREAQGNPLALLELAGALRAEQRAGELHAHGLPFVPQPVSRRIEESFAGRLRVLPERTQDLLVVAAADATGDLDVVLRAAALLEVSRRDLEAAEEARLIRVGEGRLIFTHPLIRSAAYHVAISVKRLAAHRALADSYDGEANADRRAWQLAAATIGVDETVAAELEKAAEHARTSGGYAAEAAAYERAARLTADTERRAHRFAAAASAAENAGQPRLAMSLADRAMPHTTDPVVRAQLAQLRATIADEQDLPIPSGELAAAAAAIADRSPQTSALMLFDAVLAMLAVGAHDAVAETAKRLAQLRPAEPALTDATEVVVGLACGEPRQGMQALRDVLAARELSRTRELRERAILQPGFLILGDVEGAFASAEALVRDCRALGAIGLLPRALMHLGQALLLLGRYGDVRAVATEGLHIVEDTPQPHFAGHLSGLLAYVAAIEGDEKRCLALTDQVIGHEITGKGAECVHALSVLDLALGRHDEAFARLERIADGPTRHIVTSPQSVPHHVEAAVRVGRSDRGAELCVGLEICAEAAGAAWAKAVALRCRALVADANEAGELYARAVRLHAQGGPPFERARTELLYGECLRRHKKRVDARVQLRSALQTFDRLGALPWAQRARTELRAAGETPPAADRGEGLLDRLTPQEIQVVRLAAAGLSNRDISAQMFLSPRTVGYHLYKAYPKLGITSRNELVRMNLGADPP